MPIDLKDNNFQKFVVTDVKPKKTRKGELYGWQVFFHPTSGHPEDAIVDVFKKKPGTPAPRKNHLGRVYFRGAARGRDGTEEMGWGVVINSHVYFYRNAASLRDMYRRNTERAERKERRYRDKLTGEQLRELEEFKKGIAWFNSDD